VEQITVESPHGNSVRLAYREDTSDLATIGATFRLWGKLEDEYGLAGLYGLEGTALDIGAHIGTVGMALLADHPDLRVIAVEPLAENAAVIRESANLNGWRGRITILVAAIGSGAIAYDFQGDENMRNHRYIGGLAAGTTVKHKTTTVPVVTIAELVAMAGVVPVMKIDCEGCEWAAFADPAVASIRYIVGEGHGQGWLERVRGLLPHVVTPAGGDTFRAVAQ
jgi:FkbM family methyltransferase